MRLCPKTGHECAFCPADHCTRLIASEYTIHDWNTPITAYKFPEIPKFAYIPLDELRSIYSGLGRAIESGDPLQIGLILGQVYKQLEQYVNTDTTGDHSFTVPVNTEGSALQSSNPIRPSVITSDKAGSIPTNTE